MNHSHDNVFEVNLVTQIRLDMAPTPVNTNSAALLAFVDSAPDDHTPDVPLAHTQRVDASYMPEQDPDLISNVVTIDDAMKPHYFHSLRCLSSTSVS